MPLALPTSERARALIGWLALHPGTPLRADRRRAAVAGRARGERAGQPAHGGLGGPAGLGRRRRRRRPRDGPRPTIGLRARRLGGRARRTRRRDGPSASCCPGSTTTGCIAARERASRAAGAGAGRAPAGRGRARRLDRATPCGWSRQRCALAPLDEAAHRDLLRRLDRGRRPGRRGARRAGEFAERLRAELGVRPSPATRAVAAAAARGAERGPPPSPLFGRGRGAAALTGGVAAAADGRGQVVVLTGEAGIGKTTLLAELARRVGAAGGRTAAGGRHRRRRRDAVRRLARAGPGAGRGRRPVAGRRPPGRPS